MQTFFFKKILQTNLDPDILRIQQRNFAEECRLTALYFWSLLGPPCYLLHKGCTLKFIIFLSASQSELSWYSWPLVVSGYLVKHQLAQYIYQQHNPDSRLWCTPAGVQDLGVDVSRVQTSFVALVLSHACTADVHAVQQSEPSLPNMSQQPVQMLRGTAGAKRSGCLHTSKI